MLEEKLLFLKSEFIFSKKEKFSLLNHFFERKNLFPFGKSKVEISVREEERVGADTKVATSPAHLEDFSCFGLVWFGLVWFGFI